MKSRISPSERLLVQAREMLAFAEASEWEQLIELEQTRLPLFHEVFVDGIADNVELAREILSLDEETMRLAKVQMPALKQKMLMMRKSGEANNAYQIVQRLAVGEK